MSAIIHGMISLSTALHFAFIIFPYFMCFCLYCFPESDPVALHKLDHQVIFNSYYSKERKKEKKIFNSSQLLFEMVVH